MNEDDETTQFILDVIKARKAKLGNIKSVESQLLDLQRHLKEIESAYIERGKSAGQISNGVVDRIWSVGSPSGPLSNFVKHTETVTTTRKRFERDWINIAVTGRHRMGKSTLLSAITGLGREEIPTAGGESLTAAVSTIAYEDIDMPRAVVQFHDRESLLREFIQGYYKELGWEGYERFLDDGYSLPGRPKQPTATQIEYYSKLREFHKRRADYMPFLTGGSRQFTKSNDTDKDWIWPYIAWRDPTIEHERPSEWTCQVATPITVKSVEIFCRFKNLQVQRVRLIDMPGLGELRIGLQQTLEAAIREQADITVFVTRPDNLTTAIDDNITDMHNILTEAMAPITPDKAVVAVINNTRKSGDNIEQCRRLQLRLQNSFLAAGHEIVDCSNEEEVLCLLQILLRVLRDQLPHLDRVYLNDRMSTVSKCVVETERYLQELNRSISGEMQQHADRGLSDKERNLHYYALCAEMDAAVNELRKLALTPDQDVTQALQRVRERILSDELLPTVMQVHHYKVGQDGLQGAYWHFRKRIRADIWRCFSELGEAGNIAISKAKLCVADTLLKPSHLAELTGPKSGIEFLYAAGDLFEGSLKPVFREFVEYHHSLKFLEFCLYGILPIMSDEPSDIPGLTSAEAVVQQLEEDRKTSAQRLAAAAKEDPILKKLLEEPNIAAFTIARKLYDRAFFATDARESWTNLWDANKDRIWSAKYGNIKRTRQYLEGVHRTANATLQIAQSLRPFAV